VDVDVDQQFLQGAPLAAANTSAITRGPGTLEDFGFDSFLFPGNGPEGSLFDAGSHDGFTGGGQLGYNRQFGHWVIGVEGDFNRTSNSTTQTFTGTQTSSFFLNTDGVGGTEFVAVTDVTSIRRVETDWTASARARFGWASDHVLLYVTGGAAWTHLNVFANDTARTDFTLIESGIIPAANTNGVIPIIGGPGVTVIPLGATSDSNFAKTDDVVFGWTGGGGGEWAFNDKVSVGVEYRHSGYGDNTYHFSNNGSAVFSGPMKVGIDSDQVTIRFNVLISHFFGH
jgi:opacity protein-like surface antigen